MKPNNTLTENRVVGKPCAKHPELQGVRTRVWQCVACQRERHKEAMFKKRNAERVAKYGNIGAMPMTLETRGAIRERAAALINAGKADRYTAWNMARAQLKEEWFASGGKPSWIETPPYDESCFM